MEALSLEPATTAGEPLQVARVGSLLAGSTRMSSVRQVLRSHASATGRRRAVCGKIARTVPEGGEGLSMRLPIRDPLVANTLSDA
jgi:hypothetical protein